MVTSLIKISQGKVRYDASSRGPVYLFSCSDITYSNGIATVVKIVGLVTRLVNGVWAPVNTSTGASWARIMPTGFISRSINLITVIGLWYQLLSTSVVMTAKVAGENSKMFYSRNTWPRSELLHSRSWVGPASNHQCLPVRRRQDMFTLASHPLHDRNTNTAYAPSLPHRAWLPCSSSGP